MFEAAALFLIALVGGVLPLLRRWSERQLHASLALSTGILLGAVFFHLLPSISAGAAEVPVAPAGALEAHEHEEGGHEEGGHEDEDHAAEAGSHQHGSVLPWLFVLVGVLGVYLVEALVLRTHDYDELHRHRAVSFATLTGLSLHSFTAGVSFTAAVEAMGGSRLFFVAFLIHQGLEAFSLTTVFQLAAFPNRRLFLMVVAFAAVTPAGMLVGNVLSESLTAGGMAFFSALAAGTFLFVCLCELLPEVFHHREDSLTKIALLTVGIGVILTLHQLGA